MKHTLRWLITAAVLLGLVAVALSSLVVVDETEFAVVTSFGQIAAVYGDDPSEAGLHVKPPWQLALKIDKRVKVFEPAPREVITGDKRNLEVASYVVWRVADPVLFLRASGSHELAEARLYERVSASLSDAIGRRDLSALASTDAKLWALDELTREVTTAVAPAAASELGVDVLDIRLRRFNHPVEVRPAVFDLIRSERRQVAAKTRAEGEAQYVTITSQADRTARYDPGPGRSRGPACPRQRRSRVDPHSQPGPCTRPQVFRVPPRTRFVSLDPGRSNDSGAVVVESFAQAIVAGALSGTGHGTARRAASY